MAGDPIFVVAAPSPAAEVAGYPDVTERLDS